MKLKEQGSLVAPQIETRHRSYIFRGLGSGAEATDVVGTAGEGGGELAGAGVTALSSSSLISTLHICSQAHVRTHT